LATVDNEFDRLADSAQAGSEKINQCAAEIVEFHRYVS
jgi:hypothetical protein